MALTILALCCLVVAIKADLSVDPNNNFLKD